MTYEKQQESYIERGKGEQENVGTQAMPAARDLSWGFALS